MTIVGATTIPDARASARFWALIAVFALLIVGTVDIVARLWAASLTLCDAPCDSRALGGLAFLAWYLAANGLVLVVGVLLYWLVGCVLGWWRARRGDDATVASHGGGAWAVVIALLLIPNVAGVALLIADALHATTAQSSSEAWISVVVLVSNVGVLAYYSVRRRWDGARP